MATIITDANITSQIVALANTGNVDPAQIVALMNSVLPSSEQFGTATTGVTTGVYKRFGDFDKVNAKVEIVTTGLWSNGSGSCNTFYTSSTQVVATSGEYYYNVYQTNPQSDSAAEVQFAVAYGHVYGSGSISLLNDDNALLATKATYAQYKSMLLNPTDEFFSFVNSSGTTTNSNDIYVINLSRSRYREQMDAGNWELLLSGSSGLISFIDDSGKKFGDTLGKAGRVFNVGTGSLNLGTQLDADDPSLVASNGLGYGLFYPDRGIIVLNPSALGSALGTIHDQTPTSLGTLAANLSTSANQYNQKKLYHAIRKGGDFNARRTENVSTQHFFVRATNREFNYSNNPTYVNTDGSFTETSFETDPQTYITTIGLYNDSNELIAVAKTSQPIPKSFDREVLIKVKLSF